MSTRPTSNRAQFVDSAYPQEGFVEDAIDAGKFLFNDMAKIATRKVPLSEVRRFARESMKAALMLTSNGTKRLEIK